MLIVLPRFVDVLLRLICRLFIVCALIWIGIDGMALYNGDGLTVAARLAGARPAPAVQPTSAAQGTSTTQGSTTVPGKASTQTTAVRPEASVQPIPYVLVCTPRDHLKAFQDGDPLAVEYEIYVQKQLARHLDGLNDPRNYMRQRHPGKAFVIIVNKREARFTPDKADRGMMALLTTVPYNYRDSARERRCPPESVRASTHPGYRPEFAATSYEAQWKPVPGLLKP